MKSVSTRHEDGTIDTCQLARVASRLDPARLERIYWEESRRATYGLVRFSRDAVRFLGVWPALLRFGPPVEGRRAIVGGLFARRRGGAIAWRAGGGETAVSVEGFAPLLRGPLWRLELWFHERVGRGFLARVEREAA